MDQQIGRQSRRDIIFEYLEGQRKVELELTLDFIGQLRTPIDGVAPAFVKRSQFAGQLIVRLPGFEPIAMAIRSSLSDRRRAHHPWRRY